MIRYVPHDKRISTLIGMIGEPVVIYPSYVDRNLNTYGLGMFCDTIENKKSPPSTGIFDFFDFSSESFFVFKTIAFRLVEPVIKNIRKPFLLHKNSLFFANCEDEVSLEGWDVQLDRPPFSRMKAMLVDPYTNDFNPLKHMLSFDQKISIEEKKSLMLAIQKGFPYRDIRELSEMFGKLRNITPTLERAIATFAELNKANFLFIQRVLPRNSLISESHKLSTESLSLFIKKAYENTRILSKPGMPQMFVSSITVDAIIELKEELLDSIHENLMKHQTKFGDFKITIIPARSHYFFMDFRRYRFRFKWNFEQSPLDIHQIPYLVNDFEKFTIIPALIDTDCDLYSNFTSKRSKELWIRSTSVEVLVSDIFSNIVKKTIEDHFLETLLIEEGKHPIRFEIFDKNISKISFDVYLRPYYDYVVSKRENGLFFSNLNALDEFTLKAIEYARKKRFDRALEILERGRCALEGDLMMWKYKYAGSSDNGMFEKAMEFYSKAKLENNGPDGSYFRYLAGKTPEEVTEALEWNHEWKNSILLYKEGIRIRKEILRNPFAEEICSPSSNAEFAGECFAYSDLIPVRDTVDFVDNLSSFYAKMLANIQRESGDMTTDWTFSSHL